MLQMLRRFSPLVLLIALLIAAEPLLHNHPLESSASARSGNSACVICATTGIGQLPTVAAVAAAPRILDHTYVCVAPPIIAIDAPLPRSPRAPPAA
jgi:hypothetical protein